MKRISLFFSAFLLLSMYTKAERICEKLTFGCSNIFNFRISYQDYMVLICS